MNKITISIPLKTDNPEKAEQICNILKDSHSIPGQHITIQCGESRKFIGDELVAMLGIRFEDILTSEAGKGLIKAAILQTIRVVWNLIKMYLDHKNEKEFTDYLLAEAEKVLRERHGLDIGNEKKLIE